MNLFGYTLEKDKKKKKEDEVLSQASFSLPSDEDGALTVSGGESFGVTLDLDGVVRSEADLVSRYRGMMRQAEVDNAVEEIVNDAMVIEDNKKAIEIVLDDIKQPVAVQKAIQEEFNNVLTLLDINRYGYDIFRKWYVDGRLYYEIIINKEHPDEGIKELRYIDPRKIRKIREVKKIRDKNNPYAPTLQKTVAEYYIYNDRGFAGKGGATTYSTAMPTTGIRISVDSIVYVPSGLTDENGTMVLGYLNKAIKPLNQLRSLEDACLIYAISRAPARRIFNIEMGLLPKMKAEQALRDMMVKHKNRVSYDAGTGEVRDDRKFTTMLEDYWFIQRDGKGVTVDQLEAGPNPSSIEILSYFQTKLFNSLNVPLGRMQQDGAQFPGLATEVTHEENKFARFTDRIRTRFSQLFVHILKQQLVLKGIVTLEEYDEFSKSIKFQWARDTYTEELKDIGVMTQRVNLFPLFQPMIGVYFSNYWFRKNIMKMTNEDIEEEDIRIADESINPQFAASEPSSGGGGGFGSDDGDNFTLVPPPADKKKPDDEKADVKKPDDKPNKNAETSTKKAAKNAEKPTKKADKPQTK